MRIAIVQGSDEHLQSCKEAFIYSEIGRVYCSSEEAFERFLARTISQGEVFVALDESGLCLGYVSISIRGCFSRFPYLRTIAVGEEYRGLGVGNQLMDFFENEGFQCADKVFLLVSDFNTRAKKLYEQRGYEQVGLIPDLVVEGVAECLMMKRKGEISKPDITDKLEE